jgi:hypothetical protein
MKRLILAALVLALSIGLVPQAARAQDNSLTSTWNAFVNWLSHGQDPRLTYVGIGIGIGGDVASYYLTKKHGFPPTRSLTPLGAYGATSAGCILVYPFVGTIVLNRPLTPREVYTGMADCIVPFIGSWAVDKVLPHDAWTDGTPVPVKLASRKK